MPVRGPGEASGQSGAFAPGSRVRVCLVKRRPPNVEYPAIVAYDDGTRLAVEATWSEETTRDLGFVRFEPGDVFTEHYWRDRWYSIKEIRGPIGGLKGWYCDVTRPVRVEEATLISDDLDLDLWVSADGQTIIRLDEEDFAAGGIAEADPYAAAEARKALEELEKLAVDRFEATLRL